MMVTITSMKKLQEPDLLLDQPRYHLNNHHRFTNNLNKTPRSSPRHSPKTRKGSFITPKDYPSPTSTISTSISSSSPFEERPIVGVVTQNHVVVDGLDENTRWSSSSRNNASPSDAWIRTKASSASSTSSRDEWNSKCLGLTNCFKMSRKHLIVLLIVSLILITSLVTILAVLLRNSGSESSLLSDTRTITSSSSGTDSFTSSDDININQVHDTIEEVDENGGGDENYDYETSENSNNNLDLKEVSRLSWNLLNSNQEKAGSGSNKESAAAAANNNNNHNNNKPHRNHHTSSPSSSNLVPSSLSGMRGGEEVILPSKMIFTSTGDLGKSTNLTPNSSGENNSNNKKRSCCRTQKYSQIIKRDGCEPLTIPNRMCFGQCVSVWVPGLFASFPVCRPSRSSWKTVTLTCGRNRKRVRIEKVRRCSCMELEPTAASSPSILR